MTMNTKRYTVSSVFCSVRPRPEHIAIEGLLRRDTDFMDHTEYVWLNYLRRHL